MNHLLLLCIVARLGSVVSAYNYVRYANYSAVDFDATPGQFVPTENDCVALSNAAADQASNGVVYNDASKTCKLLTTTNNEIVVKLRVNTGWVVYVKDISTSFRTVFKTENAYAGTTKINVGGMFNGSSTEYVQNYNTLVASYIAGQSCNCTYRNPAIDGWNVSQVMLQFIVRQTPVASLTFNPSSDSLSWFSQTNLMGVLPYSLSTMRLQSYVSFMPVGPYSDRWFITSTVEGSCTDQRYTLVSVTTVCTEAPPNPQIYFSYTRSTSQGSSIAFAKADFLTVSAKFRSRVIFT